MVSVIPKFRAVPPSTSQQAGDNETQHVLFFSTEHETIHKASTNCDLTATQQENVVRVAGTSKQLKKFQAELIQCNSEHRKALKRYLHPQKVWKTKTESFPLDKAIIMGILILTTVSFSGEGVGSSIKAALKHAHELKDAGASIVDVGGESARGSRPRLTPQEEIGLVTPVIKALAADGFCVSVDTYKKEVAHAAINAGASIINDISGHTVGTGALEEAAQADAGYVLNFNQSVPKQRVIPPPDYEDVVTETIDWMGNRLEQIEKEIPNLDGVVIDPGMAFGKSHDEDIQIFRRFRELNTFGLPILLAHSRKNYIGSISGLDPEQRDLETHLSTILAFEQGARIFRVHDVAGTKRTLIIASAMTTSNPGDFAPNETWPWSEKATASSAVGKNLERKPPPGQRW